MIAKRIDTKAKTPRLARLVKYVVAAQGGIDPRSWTRTADYMLNSGTSNRGEKVGGVRVTNCHTDDPGAATALIECTQAANTRSKTDKTYHLIFSFPPGEEPDLKTLHAIEDRLCASIGYADHQRISAVHIDTDHLHVHVAINKVHPTGYQNIEPYFDKKRLMETCERLELEYGLTRTNHGLTGEKKHVKHREIELSPDSQVGVHSIDGIYQPHVLALTTEYERSDNYGLPELPGSNVARIERGYSELLPGDARNRLFSEREERPEGLRWEGLGINSAGSEDSSRPSETRSASSKSGTGGPIRLSTKQAQAEAHSGIETLTGFIQREVAPAIHKAGNWQQLHASLAEHGLEIKKRGAGLVIGSGETWVRASQCDRSFSLKGLTDRLGSFELAGQVIKRERYQPKPRQSHPSSAALFEIYQRDRDKYKKVRVYGFEQAKYEGAVLEANLQKYKVFQRSLIKLAGKGPQRRAGLKLLTLQVAAMRKANWQKIEDKRRSVFTETAFPSWASWLSRQAENGNTDALAVLRSRQEREAIQGDTLTAAQPASAETVILKGLKLAADAKGALHYNTTDGGLVIDRKSHVQSYRTTTESSLMALELATKRFKGQALIVEGQESFQKEVAHLAGVRKINVRFADPALERIRNQANPPRKTIDNEIEI